MKSRCAQSVGAEALECRRLLTASVQPNGVAFVEGTYLDDAVIVWWDAATETLLAKVKGRTTALAWNGGDFDAVVIDTRRGNDFVQVLSSADGFAALPFPLTIWTHAGNDTIVGGDGPERLNAGDDDDFVTGGDGRDTIYGGPGPGADFLRGGGGSDLIDGEDGADTIFGDAGNDNVSGGANPDRLRGGGGNDHLSGGGGRDVLGGEGGDDRIAGGRADDVLSGGDGNDHLRGDAGNDLVLGDGGDDDVSGGEGAADRVAGGAGDDVLHTGDFPNMSDEDIELVLELDAPAEILDVPPVPGGFTVSRNGDTVSFIWEWGHEDVHEFEIHRSTDGGATWAEVLVSEDPSQRTGEIHGLDLDDGQSHVFRMRAKSYGVVSDFGPISTPVAAPLRGVATLTGTGYADSILLSWVDLSSAEDQFRLFMREAGVATWTKVATIAANPDGGVMTRAVRGLNAETDYQFFVRTYHAGGVTIDSATATIGTNIPRIDVGPREVSLPAGTPYVLALDLTGGDPGTVQWEIDWGDDAPAFFIEPGASPQELVLTHTFDAAEDRPLSYVLFITARRTAILDVTTVIVTVAARG